jgi:hypothetical protein
MSNVLPANRTRFHLLRALDASTHVATIVEERVNLLGVTNLAHITLLIGYFPVGRTFAPPFSIFESADVLVPSSLLHERALTVLLTLKPGSFVDVAVLVDHLAFTSRAFTCDIWPAVSLAIGRDMSRRRSMIQAFEYGSRVIVGAEYIDRLVPREGLSGMISCSHPLIARKLFRVREFTFREKSAFTR